jgi:hypothetical protein
MVHQQSLPKHLCFHDACALQMPKRIGPTEAQQAAAKRGREAAAEAPALRLRNAAPVPDRQLASATGGSSSTVSSSASHQQSSGSRRPLLPGSDADR